MTLAGMATGRPSDTDPNAWFCLTVQMDQNCVVDEAFQASHKLAYVTSTSTSSNLKTSMSSQSILPLRFTHSTPISGNPVPLDIGAARKAKALPDREWHGFLKPAGFSGVRVQVGNSVPPKNPYLWHGFWVTCTVTRHMRDLPLGHQRRRWQQLDGNGEPSTLTLATTTTFHSGMPQDEQHDRKRVMGRMTRAGEGLSRPPPIVWYVSFIFLIFRRSGEGYAPPRCVFAVST